jgi:hypothetical protein
VRSRTARVMTTLMRNGRDRRSENPLPGHARKERVLLVGTDQRITSGPAATAAASQPRKPSKREQAVYMAAPERFAEGQIFSLAPRAPSIHGPDPPSSSVTRHGGFRAQTGRSRPSPGTGGFDPEQTSAARFCRNAQHTLLERLSIAITLCRKSRALRACLTIAPSRGMAASAGLPP